jgi:uncharacterized Zn-binding protein involved in type VI secretion
MFLPSGGINQKEQKMSYKIVSRINDRWDGYCKACEGNYSGHIITGTENGTCHSEDGIARHDDLVLSDCGHKSKIIATSTCSVINGRPVVRVGDRTDENPLVGAIVTGCAGFTTC